MDISDVSSVTAETKTGAFGILPHRLDCVAALIPGILSFRDAAGKEQFIALDEGILVKTGFNIMISVRRAIGGADLDQLHQLVEEEFLRADAEEQNMHATMVKLETGFLRRFASFQER